MIMVRLVSSRARLSLSLRKLGSTAITSVFDGMSFEESTVTLNLRGGDLLRPSLAVHIGYALAYYNIH